jgi:Rrf2 family protein
MVLLTRKADYALLAMAYLGHAAGRNGGVCSAREIAARYGIPLSVLMNILKTLQRVGLVTSTRGAHGGYVLARPADSINLADIIGAVEGPVQVTHCSEHPDGLALDSCERSPWCPVRGPAQVVQNKLDQFFRDIRLADVVERSCPSSVAALSS